MPLTYSFRNKYSQAGAAAAAWTFLTCDIGTAAADRNVLVGVHHKIRALGTVTVDGVTAASIGATVGTSSRLDWRLSANPTNTSVTIVCNFTGGTEQSPVGISIWAVYGTVLATAYDTATASINTSGASTGLNTDTLDDGCIFGIAHAVNSGGAGSESTFVWSGLTEVFDATMAAANNTYSGADFDPTADETPRTISITQSSTNLAGSNCSANVISLREPIVQPRLKRHGGTKFLSGKMDNPGVQQWAPRNGLLIPQHAGILMPERKIYALGGLHG